MERRALNDLPLTPVLWHLDPVLSVPPVRRWARSWRSLATTTRRRPATCCTPRTCGPAETSTRRSGRSAWATPSRGSTNLRPCNAKTYPSTQTAVLYSAHTCERASVCVCLETKSKSYFIFITVLRWPHSLIFESPHISIKSYSNLFCRCFCYQSTNMKR